MTPPLADSLPIDEDIQKLIDAGDVAGLRRHWAERIMRCLTDLFASLGRLDAAIREEDFDVAKPMAAEIARASRCVAEVDVLIAESEDVSYNAFVKVVSFNFQIVFENISILLRTARDAKKPKTTQAAEDVCLKVSDVANADCFRSYVNGFIAKIVCENESSADLPTTAL